MESRFLYHANALALGGHITRPFLEILEGQGSAVLPISGGSCSARVSDFRHRQLVSFRSAHSVVSGSETPAQDAKDGRPARQREVHTLSTVTIEGLNIAGIVTADLVVARLTSKHSTSGDDSPVLAAGSHISNLRVAGVKLDLTPHPVLTCETLADVKTKCQGADVLYDVSGGTIDVTKDLPKRDRSKPGAPYEDRRIVTSMFKDLSASQPLLDAGCTPRRGVCQVFVPNFGHIFFGEFIVTRYSRRLTMLRLELGSPDEGNIEAAVVEGNGDWNP